jgi:protein-S-isoprenylcysteine O-methyltransferase Ste14
VPSLAEGWALSDSISHRKAPTPLPGQALASGSVTESSPARERDIAGVIAPPPLIFLAGLAVGFGLQALLPETSLPAALRWVLGGALLVAGLALLFSFERVFQLKRTPANPWRPTTALATDGPYRLTRNPAYVGMALVYVAIAVLAASLWVLLPLPLVLAIIDRGVIAREERYLERKFGQEYLDYKRRVRRWL